MEDMKGKIFTKEELELQGIRSTNVHYAGLQFYARKEERYLIKELEDGRLEIHIAYKLQHRKTPELY